MLLALAEFVTLKELCCPSFDFKIFHLRSWGDSRGSSPRPPLVPQSDVASYSASCRVRLFGLFMVFSAISRIAFVCCVLARASPVAVRLQ